MECNAYNVVICKGFGFKQHTPLTWQFQGNHVRTNECVQHGQKVASPGWDGTNTGSQSRDWEWNQWRPRGTKQDQEVVTTIALWKYKPRSSCKTWFIVLSNWNSINKALSCLTMLSCPRCGSGNLMDRKITQHESYLLLHRSKHIVPCTKRHIRKEVEVQFIDGRLTLLFSPAARTFHTTANVTSHNCDSGYKLSKNFFGTSSLFPYMVLFTLGGPAQARGSLSHESKKNPILNSSENKQSKVCGWRKDRPLKKIDFPLPLPPPRGILLAFFPKSVHINRRIGRRSGITKLLFDATTMANFLCSVHPLRWACQQQKNHKNL